MENQSTQGRSHGLMGSIRRCFTLCSSHNPETKPYREEPQGQTIRVNAGVEAPSAERVVDFHRIQNLEIQVKALQDEVARIAEIALKNSSKIQKTTSATKTVADDTAVLATAVKDLTAMVNKLAHSVKSMHHENS